MVCSSAGKVSPRLRTLTTKDNGTCWTGAMPSGVSKLYALAMSAPSWPCTLTGATRTEGITSTGTYGDTGPE